MENRIETASKQVAPWIGIGTSGEWGDVDVAMRECGLDFEVKSKALKFQYEDDEDDGIVFYGDVHGHKATVREDTHEALGCVRSSYKIIQNKDIFSMLNPFLQSGGKITHGGMTNEGLCFLIVEMQQMVIGGEAYDINIMATNSFNGMFKASLICSPVRIICQNMYRQLMGNSDNVMHFLHTMNVYNRIGLIKSALDSFNVYGRTFKDNIEMLKATKAKYSIDEIVSEMFPYTNTDEQSKRFQSSKELVDATRTSYIENYYRSDTNDPDGSCFSLVNAYYDYTSHSVPKRATDESYRSKRLSSTVGGTLIKPKLMQLMCTPK